jgi:flagellar FliJ protein
MSERNRGERLRPVASLAKNEETRAAHVVRKRQARQQQDSQQLEQLQAFREEYEQRLQQMSASGLPATQLADFRRFLSNLNRAVDSQRDSLTQSESALASSREQWSERAAQRAGIDTFIARHARAEERRRARADDRESSDRHAAVPPPSTNGESGR